MTDKNLKSKNNNNRASVILIISGLFTEINIRNY